MNLNGRVKRLEAGTESTRYPTHLAFRTEEDYREACRVANDNGVTVGGPLTKVYVGLDLDRV